MKLEATIDDQFLFDLIQEQLAEYDFSDCIEDCISDSYSVDSTIESKCDEFSRDISNDVEEFDVRVTEMEEAVKRITETLEAMAAAFSGAEISSLQADLDYQKSQNESLRLQLAEVNQQSCRNPQI